MKKKPKSMADVERMLLEAADRAFEQLAPAGQKSAEGQRIARGQERQKRSFERRHGEPFKKPRKGAK